MKCYRLSLVAAVVILVSLPQCAQAAMQWTEQGDAGAFLSTANETTGQGDLEAIIGMLVDDDWIDMFAIQIDDMSLFQASTDNFLEPDGTRLFDTWLYLFDSTGKGVAASGSTESSDGLVHPNATITQGSVSGAAGLYYLAITKLDVIPFSNPGEGSLEIFPYLVSSSRNGEVVGPTGPGGGAPLSSWTWDTGVVEFEPDYRIDLLGATFAQSDGGGNMVPEPAAVLVWTLLGMAGFGFIRQRVRGRLPK